MGKIKLNKKQKSIVANWCNSRKNARIEQLIDRTCQYKDAIISWQLWVNQPNNRIAIIYYHTRLELVRSGPIRVEETKQIKVDYIGGVIEGELVPLYNILPPPPKKRVVNSLYPKNRDRNRIKRKKNIQFSLPLTQTEQRLQEISIESGDPTIYSQEELLSGREGWYSLDQNRTIWLPKAILSLLKDFNCSLSECEAIANLSGVLKPQDLLFWVEQIPQMRKLPEFKTFQEPVPVTNIDRHTTTTTIQTQTLKSQTKENY